MPSGRDLPDWLRELTPQETDDAGTAATTPGWLHEVPPEAPAAPPEPAAPRTSRRRRSRRSATGGLQPWQRFVLALLLFLNVAIIGLLLLTMLGRIAIP